MAARVTALTLEEPPRDPEADGTIDTRVRMIEAADAVRRRLERDLHDGAQQRLVLTALMLGRALDEARGTPVEPLVAEAMEQLQQGLAELRDLAQGIHPSVLSERGLAAALEELVARAPVPVYLRVTRERAARAAESAIYFTVAKAPTNVAKHANASVVSVEVELDDGVLTAEIADDGVGGADLAVGSGLRGLEDRLEALAGCLTVESPRGNGTVILARVPSGPQHGLSATAVQTSTNGRRS
jgi:signal transduction histidine kinase